MLSAITTSVSTATAMVSNPIPMGSYLVLGVLNFAVGRILAAMIAKTAANKAVLAGSDRQPKNSVNVPPINGPRAKPIPTEMPQ